MYRCIVNLEIDLDGLGEFYGEIDEYETLNMYQIISAWLQDDLDGPNPENTIFGVSEYALEWMSVLPGDIFYRNLFDMGSCKVGNRYESIDYLYARFKQAVKGELISNSLIDRLEIERVYLLQNSMQILLNCNFKIDFEKVIKRWMAICSTEYHPVYYKLEGNVFIV